MSLSGVQEKWMNGQAEKKNKSSANIHRPAKTTMKRDHLRIIPVKFGENPQVV